MQYLRNKKTLMSINSKDILKKTGLKSAKTLTRWHKRGIIPEPVVRTHPSGRGKMAYWPDWVLERCVKLVELQKEGHTLNSALATIERERINRNLHGVLDQPSVSEILKNKKVKIADREISVLNVFRGVILAEMQRLVSDENFYASAAMKMDEQEVVGLALDFLKNGYNPVLLFDGNALRIMPDFLVGHHLSGDTTERKSYLLVPLLPLLRRTFEGLGLKLPCEPKAYPAPKIWVEDGDATVEYMFYPAGQVGFELIRETAKTINVTHEESEKGHET